MKTLLLSAPRDKDAATVLHRTFNDILASQIGPDYAISANLVAQISPGMKVIVFERVGRRQAEGTLTDVNATGNKTGRGIKRYDVRIRDLHEVHYTSPAGVNRCGVNVV